MSQLPVAARWYVSIISLLGLMVVLAAAIQMPTAGLTMNQAALATGLALLYGCAEAWRLTIPRKSGDQPDFSLATSVAIWAALALGPALTALTVSLGYALSLLHRRRQGAVWFKAAFNHGQLVLSYTATSFVFWAIADAQAPVLGTLQNTLAFLPVFFVYYGLNTLFVITVLALVRRESIVLVWQHHYRDTALIDLAMVPAGAMFHLLWAVSPVALLLAGLPLYVVHKCFVYIRQLYEQTKTSLFALSRTLDHRDPATYHHSEMVSTYARAIAARLGLPQAHVELIAEAARLHDIGKVGVRDSILLKPGPLTPEERQEMERHPVIGAEMVYSFSVFHDGIPIIRHHHEWYNGRGYPDGLEGDRIPIGARIVHVADAFEAMTADRPYRRGMAPTIAAERLQEGAGTQFDPRAVEVMLAWLYDTGRVVPADAPAAEAHSAPARQNVVERASVA